MISTTPERGARHHLQEDTRVGSATVGAIVATGPLATVYRGRAGSESVAIKVYRSDLRLNMHEGARASREGLVHAQIKHPSVARLLETGRMPSGAPYIVTVWVEGERLEDRLARGPMSGAELFSVARSIARGLDAIHRAGVVHRDLKPSNIVLPVGGEPSAVILDFGHALVADADRLTDQGFTLGTAAYMAPEQAQGRALDGRADLYACGVILYRALTGLFPFDERSAAQMMVRHQREPVLPPRERVPSLEIAPALDDLCMWLLAKEPERRIPNAQVLIAALDAAMPEAKLEERVA